MAGDDDGAAASSLLLVAEEDAGDDNQDVREPLALGFLAVEETKSSALCFPGVTMVTKRRTERENGWRRILDNGYYFDWKVDRSSSQALRREIRVDLDASR